MLRTRHRKPRLRRYRISTPRGLFTSHARSLLLLLCAFRVTVEPAVIPLVASLALYGCASRSEPRVDGAAAWGPVGQDSVLVWQPIFAGDRARIRLRDGSHLDARVVGGNDSVLVIERLTTGSAFRSEPTDTIPRARIASVERRGVGPGATFPLGLAIGVAATLAIVIVSIQDAFDDFP